MTTLFKKIIFYERIIKLLIFLNVLSVATGITAGIYYFVLGLKLQSLLPILPTDQSALLARQVNLGWQLGIIAVFTLVFGIILPGLIVRRLSHKAQAAKAQAEKAVLIWITEYTKQMSKNSEAFKNTDFWLRMILVSLESAAQFWPHPVLNWLKESGPIIRAEFENAQKRKAPRRSRKDEHRSAKLNAS